MKGYDKEFGNKPKLTVYPRQYRIEYAVDELVLMKDGIQEYPIVATNSKGRIFGDVASAIKAGGNVTLIANAQLHESVTIGRYSSLDLNGYLLDIDEGVTLTGTGRVKNGALITVYDDSQVEVKVGGQRFVRTWVCPLGEMLFKLFAPTNYVIPVFCVTSHGVHNICNTNFNYEVIGDDELFFAVHEGEYEGEKHEDSGKEVRDAIIAAIGRDTPVTPAQRDAAEARIREICGEDCTNAVDLAKWIKDCGIASDAFATSCCVRTSFELGVGLMDCAGLKVCDCVIEPQTVAMQVAVGPDYAPTPLAVSDPEFMANLIEHTTDLAVGFTNTVDASRLSIDSDGKFKIERLPGVACEFFRLRPPVDP